MFGSMMQKRRIFFKSSSTLIWLILIIALVLRLLYLIVVVGPNSFPGNIDSIEHHIIAQNIIQGKGYSMYGNPTAYRAPFLTYLMAALYFIFGEHFVIVRLSIIVMSIILIWAIYHLSKLIFNSKVGLWAAFLAAIYPHLIFYNARIFTETPFTLFSLLAMVFFVKFFKTKKVYLLLPVGFFIALAILTRPVGFMLLLFLLLYLSLRPLSLVNFRNILILTVVVAVFLMPWIVRNYLVFQRFIPVTSQGGVVLWVSNNHYIAHHPYYHGLYCLYQQLPGAINLVTPDEISRSQYAYKYCWNFLKEYPEDIPRLIWSKTFKFWDKKFFTASSRYWIYENFYFIILILSVVGSYLTIRLRNYKAIYLWMIILANFIPALIFWAGARVRLPLEPVLIIFCALTLEQARLWLWQKLDKIF